MAAKERLTPADIVEPVTALQLTTGAVGELSPWRGDHGSVVEKVRREAAHHVHLAEALVREPGIERWWAPLDRDNQVWIEPESRDDFPDPDNFPTPANPPTRHEIYAQFPERRVMTSNQVQELTSQEATIFAQWSDWYMNYPARRKRIQAAPGPRIYEVTSATASMSLSARRSGIDTSLPCTRRWSAMRARSIKPYGGRSKLLRTGGILSVEHTTAAEF
jgi:hypothetical protein